MPNGDQTVMVYNPQGVKGTIPKAQADAAKRAGYRLVDETAVMIDPKTGGRGFVPKDKVTRARAAGYVPSPEQMAEEQHAATRKTPMQTIKAPGYELGQHVAKGMGLNVSKIQAAEAKGGQFGGAVEVGGQFLKGLPQAAKAVARDPFTLVTFPAQAVEKAIKEKDPGQFLGALAIALPAGDAPFTAASAAKGSVDWIGSASRASKAFTKVETQATRAGVMLPAVPSAFRWALEAKKLEPYGFTVPPVISDFIDRVTNTQQGPLSYAEARLFSESLGQKIPWDEFGGKGGKVWGAAKKMRSALESQIESSLPSSLVEDYKGAKANWAKAITAAKRAQTAGTVVGGVAGYEVGKAMGLPHSGYIGAGAGAAIGRKVAPKVVRKLTGQQ